MTSTSTSTADQIIAGDVIVTDNEAGRFTRRVDAIEVRRADGSRRVFRMTVIESTGAFEQIAKAGAKITEDARRRNGEWNIWTHIAR